MKPIPIAEWLKPLLVPLILSPILWAAPALWHWLQGQVPDSILSRLVALLFVISVSCVSSILALRRELGLVEVIRERLAFADQQIDALTRETEKLKLEKEQSETENCRLRGELQKAEKKITTLNEAQDESAGDGFG